jgi:hypothetical protein
MNTVGILNRYRKSVADDPAAFELMCLLYRSGTSTTNQLREEIGFQGNSFLKTLRELYQASLISVRQDTLRLTDLGEDVLSGMHVDDVVAASLIDSLLPRSDAEKVVQTIKWSLHSEPRVGKTTIAALRNLRVFFSATPSASLESKQGLTWTCAVRPQSEVQQLLRNRNVSPDFLMYFGHGADGKRNDKLWVDIKNSYAKALDTSERTDSFFIDACASAAKVTNVAEPLLESAAFRVFNYIHSRERDAVLETCNARMGQREQSAVLALLWPKLQQAFELKARQERVDRDLVTAAAGLGRVLSEAVNRKTSAARDKEASIVYRLFLALENEDGEELWTPALETLALRVVQGIRSLDAGQMESFNNDSQSRLLLHRLRSALESLDKALSQFDAEGAGDRIP